MLSKFTSRSRQDSISNLTPCSKAAKAEIINKQRQILLTVALLAAVITSLLFLRREAIRRRKLNEDLKFRNDRIPLLNAKINRRTNNYLTYVIRILQEQQLKAARNNINFGAVNDLER